MKSKITKYILAMKLLNRQAPQLLTNLFKQKQKADAKKRIQFCIYNYYE